MKRKPMPKTPPVIDPKIREQAKLAIQADALPRLGKCGICGETCAPNSTEGLCWVCRRLKISAWSDSDQQAAIQE